MLLLCSFLVLSEKFHGNVDGVRLEVGIVCTDLISDVYGVTVTWRCLFRSRSEMDCPVEPGPANTFLWMTSLFLTGTGCCDLIAFAVGPSLTYAGRGTWLDRGPIADPRVKFGTY